MHLAFRLLIHQTHQKKTHFRKILHKFTQIFLFKIQQRIMSSNKNHEEEDRNIDVPRGSYPSILEGKTLLKMSDIEWETIYVTTPLPPDSTLHKGEARWQD